MPKDVKALCFQTYEEIREIYKTCLDKNRESKIDWERVVVKYRLFLNQLDRRVKVQKELYKKIDGYLNQYSETMNAENLDFALSELHKFCDECNKKTCKPNPEPVPIVQDVPPAVEEKEEDEEEKEEREYVPSEEEYEGKKLSEIEQAIVSKPVSLEGLAQTDEDKEEAKKVMTQYDERQYKKEKENEIEMNRWVLFDSRSAPGFLQSFIVNVRGQGTYAKYLPAWEGLICQLIGKRDIKRMVTLKFIDGWMMWTGEGKPEKNSLQPIYFNRQTLEFQNNIALMILSDFVREYSAKSEHDKKTGQDFFKPEQKEDLLRMSILLPILEEKGWKYIEDNKGVIFAYIEKVLVNLKQETPTPIETPKEEVIV